MQALSQLSYTPKAKGAHYSHPPLARNRAALRNSASDNLTPIRKKVMRIMRRY